MRFIFSLLILFFGLGAYAQDSAAVVREDSVIVESYQDTVLIKSYAARYNPRKALLYAAVLPGLGQIYNKKYWKLPLVYGGFVALGMGISDYNKQYILYKKELYYNLENGYDQDPDIRPGDPNNASTRAYRNAVDRARRNRDFMILMMGLMYVVQIVDAHVDAHLKEFDLNPNLRVSIEPTFEQNLMLGRQTGLALVVKF